MSQASNNYIIGASGNPVDSTLAGQNVNESYLALKNPPRVQLSNTTAIQLPNCPCGYVTISNPLGNDVVYIGGLDGSNDTPYLDPNYPGQGRGQAVYPGTSQVFRVVNSNLLQAIANRNNDIINVIPHLSQSDFITPSGDPPPNPQYLAPLTVIGTSPTNGATSQLLSTVAKFIFLRNIDPTTATTTNFTISPAVATAIVYIDPTNAAEVDIDPQGFNLLGTTTYTVTAGVGIKDIFGLTLGSPASFSFTTAASSGPDTTPPTVVSTNPANGATGVSLSVDPVVVMSEAVQSATVTTSNVVLLDPNSTVVSTTVSLGVDKETITITPATSLLDGSVYTLQVSGIKDLAGNIMSSTYTGTFTTTSTFTQWYNVTGTNAIPLGSSQTYFGCGERVETTSSKMIGHYARKVVCQLALSSPSVTGSVNCYHLDNGANVVTLIGSINCSQLSTTAQTITFENPNENVSLIHGDWIGVTTHNVNTGSVTAYRSTSRVYDVNNSYTNALTNSDAYVGDSTDFAATIYE